MSSCNAQANERLPSPDPEISGHVSVRALIEKAGSWLVTPSGSRVNMTSEIGASAAFVACNEGAMVQALEAAFANACVALDGQVERRIAITTQRVADQVEIGIAYRARALSGPLAQALSGDPNPVERQIHPYRQIVQAQGGRSFAAYRADGEVVVRLLLPASAASIRT